LQDEIPRATGNRVSDDTTPLGVVNRPEQSRRQRLRDNLLSGRTHPRELQAIAPRECPRLGIDQMRRDSDLVSCTTNLAIGAIFIAGANPADFGTRHDGCSGRTLVPSDSCTVGVVFMPTALNARSAIFSVPCSDPVRGTVTMALQGNGIDKLPPPGTVTINGGAAAIRSIAATLTLSPVEYGGGAIRMCVSNTPKCTAWVAFAKTRSWKLTTGNGKKTVYAWFGDARGNATPASKPYTDTIIVDPIAPVNGRLRATPGAGQIALSWDTFSDPLSGIDRYKLVYAIGAAPASCAKGKVIHEGGSTTRIFTHTGLIYKTYGYRVCAIDKAGNVSTGATWSGKPRP